MSSTTPTIVAHGIESARKVRGHSLTAREVSAYRNISRHILELVAALKTEYPHLKSITTDAEEAHDKLWIAYHFAHGVSRVPNPDYRPGRKSSPTIKSFSSDDGIELNLYFYEGAWPGQTAVLPVTIGRMNVVTFIEGSETQPVARLRQAIGRIVANEKARFERAQHASPGALNGL